MKTKLFKRIGLLGLSTLAAFTLTSNVKAEEQCTTYKNYYYFSEINWAQGVSNNLDSSNPNPWERGHASYFPALPSTAKAAKGEDAIKKYEVCLQNGDQLSKESAASCNETWDLTKYYNREVWLAQDPTTEQFTINNNQSSYTYRSENSTDNDGDPVVTTYYRHGMWFTVDENDNNENQGGASVVYTGVPVESLVAGSFIPLTNVDIQDPQNGYMRAVVTRSVTRERFSTATPFEVYWEGTGNTESVLTPALYYIEYQDDCHEVTPTYSAKIHYCIEKSDGTCIPATDVDKDAKDYSKTGLKGETKKDANDGDGDDVKSHTIKNCKLKNAKDETVSYKIKDDNFSYEVRYVCDEAPANPKTGIALIITAWVVGLGALGYSAYYFMNVRKEENAEL